jgi:dUTP pyrophosphatase
VLRIQTIGRGKAPQRIGDESAGYDVFAASPGTMVPGEIATVPLGFKSQFPPGFVCIMKGRSGLALKGIDVLGGVVDSDYRGEWRVILVNHGKDDFDFKIGDRIAQFLMVQAWTEQPTLGELNESARGSQGFGSSGR